MSHTVHGQVTRYVVIVAMGMLDLGAFEVERRVLFRIEEVGGAQVGVAVRIAGVDAFNINFRINRRVRQVLLIDVQLPAQDLETSSYGCEHHMLR